MTRLPAFMVWMVVMVVCGFMLYKVKYQVQAVRNEVTETAREVETEKEALHVVAAEWAYLNRPQRLQTLAEKYLSSSDVTVDQISEIETIPFPGHSEASADVEGNIHPVSARMRRAGGDTR